MKKLLVLGGGQLARYIVQESHSLPVQIVTASTSSQDPAGKINPLHLKISGLNSPHLKKIMNEADLITFESEFYKARDLLKISGRNKNKFYPSLKCLGLLQDRLSQKQVLEKYKIPTLPYLQLQSRAELHSSLNEIKHLVLKSRFGGYDGYGTHIVKNASDLPLQAELADFIAEPFFKFEKELAVTLYRNSKGQKGHYPFVEWKAKDNKCFWVKGPVVLKGYQALLKKLFTMMDKMKYVGVLSFEFFQDKKGQLFVNELAPRVHNSCHYSQTAMSQSQFYTHILCGLGIVLPNKIESSHTAFAMVNLIGSGRKKTTLACNEKDIWIYDYQKDTNKKGRKLGHINSLGSSPDIALKKALKVEKKCQL